MKRSNNFQFFLMFAAFLIIILAVGKYFIDIVIKEEGLDINQQSTEVITTTQEEQLTWGEISGMIMNCEVDQVFQGHDLRVSVVTVNDQIYWGYEPQIDDILDLASQASEECDKQVIQVTE